MCVCDYSEMMGYWKEARRLQIELVQKNNETQGLRNELAQLRMELSMEKQSRLETEAKLTVRYKAQGHTLVHSAHAEVAGRVAGYQAHARRQAVLKS